MNYFVFAAMILTISIILMMVIQPYKGNISHYSIINTMFTIILAIVSSSFLGIDMDLHLLQLPFSLLYWEEVSVRNYQKSVYPEKWI